MSDTTSTKSTKRICLWSSPRNVSTALMYSFAQRADTKVFDEPLYAHFLAETNAQRPDREETLSLMENDGSSVIHNTILNNFEKPVLFFKNIANHIVGLDDAFTSEVLNVFLIRDPKEMLLSYTKVIEKPSMLDLAMRFQKDLFDKLNKGYKQPIVVDSKELLQNPEVVLKALCEKCEIDWDSKMLQWEAGPREEDGVWAKYWYHGVHQSTGFKAYQKKEGQLKPELNELYEECLLIYEYLRPFSLKARP